MTLTGMPRIEAQYPCPVCLGVKMKKARLAEGRNELLLDWCPRCGGMWFELGEVQRLRRQDQTHFWRTVERRKMPFRMPCHSCMGVMDRNEERCPSCGWKNRLRCPSCEEQLEPCVQEGLRLDMCAKCKGVWFDHIELEEIWKLSLNTALKKGRASDSAAPLDVGGFVLLEALSYSPEALFYGAHAAGMAVDAGATVLANAPALVEGAGDVAAGAFDAIAEIIASIFS